MDELEDKMLLEWKELTELMCQWRSDDRVKGRYKVSEWVSVSE